MLGGWCRKGLSDGGSSIKSKASKEKSGEGEEYSRRRQLMTFIGTFVAFDYQAL